jgi:hypothetical protein
MDNARVLMAQLDTLFHPKSVGVVAKQKRKTFLPEEVLFFLLAPPAPPAPLNAFGFHLTGVGQDDRTGVECLPR